MILCFDALVQLHASISAEIVHCPQALGLHIDRWFVIWLKVAIVVMSSASGGIAFRISLTIDDCDSYTVVWSVPLLFIVQQIQMNLHCKFDMAL